jgi:lipoate-protein ligase A
MLDLELIVEPSVDPALGAAIDRWLVNRVACRSAAARSGTLRIYAVAVDAVSLGRYHLTPDAAGSSPAVMRRHSGGRVWPVGPAYACLSLVLPHRSALVSDDPLALRPEQVLNRCVRGILEACRLAGIDPFYPGRDLVTLDGRALAAIGFEVDRRGVLLFEAVLSVGAGFDALPRMLDAADPHGRVTARLWAPGETTSLSRALDGGPAFEEVADLLRRGFADELGAPLHPMVLAETDRAEMRALAGGECGAERWLGARRNRPGLDHRATVPTQLGVLEALVALGPRREIGDVVLAGDFIARSSAVESLEEHLRSRPLERASIAPAVEAAFAAPEDFILGIGKVSTITDVLLQAGA